MDWEFTQHIEDEDLEVIESSRNNETPLELLKKQRIYSLIYIYSRENISDEIQNELKDLYGENRIFFGLKPSITDENSEYQKNLQDITDFDHKNKHMEIPFVWSQSINRSVQSVFLELESADHNWIGEIMSTASEDGGEPVSEVIDIFYNLVREFIIQDETLRKALKDYGCENQVISTEGDIAKLYQRIFYTKLTRDAPIVTGNIFKFDDNEYGILITPECEIQSKKCKSLEFLIFQKDDFEEYLYKNYNFTKTGDLPTEEGKKLKSLRKIFNNDNLSVHILPSFPFGNDSVGVAACINFKRAFSVKNYKEHEGKRTNFTLNSPYIHQSRQRFGAFFGRYGVAAVPNRLRDVNLK
ncbi:MAG: hypothetical protein ACTTIC_03115 [Helicobacteraceae bacterium]